MIDVKHMNANTVPHHEILAVPCTGWVYHL